MLRIILIFQVVKYSDPSRRPFDSTPPTPCPMRHLLLTTIACATITLAFATPNLAAQEARAKENWAKHCAKCHGEDGKANTAMGRKLKLRNYADPKVQADLKDDHIIKVTKEGIEKSGKNVMKAYAKELADDEIKELVVYIRKFNAAK
jgi:cytochrome c6